MKTTIPNHKKANTENYQEIADNDNLNWQEKYKLYSKTKNNDADTSKASYVTNMKALKVFLQMI